MAKKKRKKATRSSSKKSSRRTSPKRKKGARRAAKKAAAKKRRAAKKARKPAKKRAAKKATKRRKSTAKKKRGKAKASKRTKKSRSSAKRKKPSKAKRPTKNPKGTAKKKAPAKKAKGPARGKRASSTTITCRMTKTRPERNPGPMLGVLTCCNPERHLPGCRCVAPRPLAPRKLPKGALRNPSGKKRGGKKRPRGSALDRFLATKPVGWTCKWRDLPDAVKRDKLAQRGARAKLARLRAQGYRLELGDVLMIVRPRPKGASAAMVHVGDQIAEEYRDEGGRHYRHAAGDHGRGRKKSKPPAIAIDVVSRQQHLVGGHGVRRGFSSRGITG